MRAALLLLALLAASYHTIQARPHRSMAVQDLKRVQPTPTSHTPECLSKQKAHSVMPATLIKTFVLEWKKLSPDGGPYRNIITVNGKYPAPTIIANAGDRLVVEVVNKLNDSASIHWHGVYQNGTNEMDGVPGVTQYAIKPGTTFTYNFTLDVPGTYWYHSHFKCQYVDGLWGSLVVRDHDDHHHAQPVIAMSDTYWNSSTNLLKAFLDPANADGDEPTPNSCVMNGIGQTGKCGSKKAKYTKVVLSQSEPCDCSNVTACRQKGGITRILNTAGFATFNISIDEHLMWIVAADSVPIKPTLPVGSLRLNTGQRYDVVLCRIPTTTSKGCSNNKPAWIRASMDQSTFPMDMPYPNVMGVLQYAGTHGDHLPKTKAWPYDQVLKIDARSHISGNDVNVIDPYHLQPLDFPKPPAATVTIKLAIDIYADPNFNNSVRAHFNNMSQIELSEIKQPLLDLARQHKPYPTGKNPGPNIIHVNYNDVVEVIINNHDEGEHPIHLHGQNFWITARGDGDFEKYNSNFTYTSRDTATVPGSGHLVLRFAALNRGIWLMHCHIDWHMAAGLGMMWSVGLGQ